MCFESVTSIIFCTALSEYGQVLLEESKTVRYLFIFDHLIDFSLMLQNRKVESLVLLESVTNSRWFLRMSIIFFLNKIDVSQSKLAKVCRLALGATFSHLRLCSQKPMEKYFPEYTAVRQTGYQQDCQVRTL